MIKSNQKQYFLSFLGFSINFFQTASTGKILSKYNLKTKFLKKSEKANKYLLMFYNNINVNKNLHISHLFLKPLNRKNLNFFYLILKTFKIQPGNIGFKNYYKSVFKRVKRIKKRIKKNYYQNFLIKFSIHFINLVLTYKIKIIYHKIFIFISLNLLLYTFYSSVTYLFFNSLNFISLFSYLLNNLFFNFLFIYLFTVILKKQKYLTIFTALFIYLLLLFNKKCFVVAQPLKFLYNYKQISIELFNGLIQLHPYIFYTSAIILFYYFAYSDSIKKNKKINYIILLPQLLLFSLISGGY